MKHTPHSIAGTSRIALLSLILAFGAFLPARAQQVPAFSAAHDGVTIDCGTFGRFTLTYPTLDTGSDKPLVPVEITASDGKAKLKYAGDAEVDVSAEPDGTVSYAFLNPPAGLKTYRVSMLIDAGFSQGGKWQIGSVAGTAFPAEKPSKPHLFQGNASAFTLSNFEGKSLAFGVPAYSYQEITDNREWGWKIFSWIFVAPFEALGFSPKAGQEMRFDLAIDDGSGAGRTRQLMWNGGSRNSGDRTDWGAATLLK